MRKNHVVQNQCENKEIGSLVLNVKVSSLIGVVQHQMNLGDDPVPTSKLNRSTFPFEWTQNLGSTFPTHEWCFERWMVLGLVQALVLVQWRYFHLNVEHSGAHPFRSLYTNDQSVQNMSRTNKSSISLGGDAESNTNQTTPPKWVARTTVRHCRCVRQAVDHNQRKNFGPQSPVQNRLM